MSRQVTIATVVIVFAVFAQIVSGAAPERHAVVIGINDYTDPGIPDLKYAESDARAVYGVLTDPKVGRFSKKNVTLVLGKDATPSNIKAALYKLRGVGKNDLVVVFYSGHGAKEGDEAFWVTQNAQAKALPATALSNSDIRKYLKMIPSQKLVMFLDCCYAASTVKKSLADPTKLFGDFHGRGRVTIAGSADSQEALEYPDRKAGVFTYYLVRALSGQADTNEDGVVTFGEVWSYLGEHVRKASVKQGGLHEPVIITESGVTPQFLLTLNPTATAANQKALVALRKLFDGSKITGAQYDRGRKALSEAAIAAEARARREVFADLVAGRLAPKYLATALKDAEAKALAAAQTPAAPTGQKPTLAVVAFDVLGTVRVKDAGKILAERLLPYFSSRYRIIDQGQLARFLDQDDLTIAGLARQLQSPSTKALTKAVRLRAVRYLVVGTLTGQPGGTLSVTARICDWQRGTAVGNRFAQVRADSWRELENRLALLAGRLLGDLGAIAVGDEPKLPSLPGGVDKLIARMQQLEAVTAELKKARTLYTDKHPRVIKLAKAIESLGPGLSRDVRAKIAELARSDSDLAKHYRPDHASRTTLRDQIARLRKARFDVLFQWCPLDLDSPARWLRLAAASAKSPSVSWTSLYIPIAKASFKAGDKRGCLATIRQAIAEARGLGVLRFGVCGLIAPMAMEVGDKKGYQECIRIALAEAEAERPSLQVYLYCSIASCQCEAGDMGGAKETLRLAEAAIGDIKIKGDELKALSHCSIAEAYAKLGDTRSYRKWEMSASALAAGLQKQTDKDMPYSQLAEIQAKGGDIKKARASAARVKDQDLLSIAYLHIAEAEAEAGDLTAAGGVAEKIQDDDSRASACVPIVRAGIKAGNFSGALDVVSTHVGDDVKSPHARKSSLFRTIARAQVNAGDFAGAEAATKRCADPGDRLVAYAYAAYATGRAGDKAACRRNIDSARKAVRKTTDAGNLSLGHAYLALAQAQVGDKASAAESLQSARAAARRVTSSFQYLPIARAMARLGYFKELDKWAASSSPLARPYIQLGAAQGLLPRDE